MKKGILIGIISGIGFFAILFWLAFLIIAYRNDYLVFVTWMNKDVNNISSTCQVVFDEAFNNMDEGRIKSLMEFYKQLNVQIIIVVPSNRISAISPYMDTLIGITKISNHPYITVIGK